MAGQKETGLSAAATPAAALATPAAQVANGHGVFGVFGPAGRALLANSDLIIEALAIAACTWLAWSAFVEEPEQ